MAKELKCEILETLIEFPSEGKFHKELNLVKWGDHEPKYDLRGWNEDRSQMSKGITLTKDELILLKNELGGFNL
jgi:hypothetical protein